MDTGLCTVLKSMLRKLSSEKRPEQFWESKEARNNLCFIKVQCQKWFETFSSYPRVKMLKFKGKGDIKTDSHLLSNLTIKRQDTLSKSSSKTAQHVRGNFSKGNPCAVSFFFFFLKRGRGWNRPWRTRNQNVPQAKNWTSNFTYVIFTPHNLITISRTVWLSLLTAFKGQEPMITQCLLTLHHYFIPCHHQGNYSDMALINLLIYPQNITFPNLLHFNSL